MIPESSVPAWVALHDVPRKDMRVEEKVVEEHEELLAVTDHLRLAEIEIRNALSAAELGNRSLRIMSDITDIGARLEVLMERAWEL